MRGSARLLLALAAICAVALTATNAQAAKPRVKLLSEGQSGILAKGSLKAKVTLKVRKGSRAKVKVRGFSSTFDRPGYRALTKARHLRFKRSGSRRVSLPLTSAGENAIGSCQARTLRVKAGSAKAFGELVRQSAACKPRPVDLSMASQCDFIGSQGDSLCMLPFPDDFHTVSDPATETGRRVNFQSAAMPANSASVHIDAAAYDENDGFSPGQGIVVRVPGLDNSTALAETAPVPINDLGRYTGKRTPVVVIDATTGERWPIWVEIDSNAAGPDETALEIHPARNFDAKHRYIVAMRNLKDSEGDVIPAPEGFRYYRDDLPSSKRPINKWRGRFDSIFSTLREAEIRRANLYLAWDFTVASDQNIARRALHIRDDAFAQLGDTDLADGVVAGAAPSFTVDTVNTDPKPNLARRVRGSFEVPCYLFPSCDPGGRFKLDAASGLPIRNGSWTANFDCTIPHSAVDDLGASPARPAVYGHGLFGSASEVYNADIQNEFSQDYNFVLCATDEIGMSGGDIANTGLHILPDLSNFPELADRLQQGLLNELYLGRLMDTTAAQGGFLTDANFHADGATLGSAGVIDPSELYYDGSSQGGIMGGALTALSPDFTRAALNVPAMNYSVLLPRSVDYEPFAQILEANYSDDLSHPLILSLIQMLWDRGEPNGYAHRMTTDPLPQTPAHEVLMSIAFGDHQVTNFQADVEARTIGAQTHAPILYPGRWPGVDVLWDVPAISSYPYGGSAAIYFDIGPERVNPSPPPPGIGVSPPPLTNVPNESGEDPHGAPRGAPTGLHLISDFLAPDGAVTNLCGADACYSGGFTGP